MNLKRFLRLELHTEGEVFKPSLCGSTQQAKFTKEAKEGQSRIAQDDLRSWLLRPCPLDLWSEKVSEELLFVLESEEFPPP